MRLRRNPRGSPRDARRRDRLRPPVHRRVRRVLLAAGGYVPARRLRAARSSTATGFADPARAGHAHKTNLGDIALEETDAGGILAARLLLDRAAVQRRPRPPRAPPRHRPRRRWSRLMYPVRRRRTVGAAHRRRSRPAPRAGRSTAETSRSEPGYRTDPAGRAEDIAEAKQLWAGALRRCDADGPARSPSRGIPQRRSRIAPSTRCATVCRARSA